MPLTSSRPVLGGISRLSIRWLFVIALLPCMVAGLALFLAYLDEKRAELEVSTLQTARAVAEAIDKDLAGIIGNLRILATSPHLETGNLEAFHGQVKRIADAEELVNVIALIHPGGDLALISLRPFGSQLPKTSHPDELKKVLATWRPVVSDMYIGAVSQQPYISVQVPVRVTGEPFSLIMAVPTIRLAHILTNVKLPAGYVAAIADSKGRIVARSHRHEETVGGSSPPAFMEELKKNLREGVFKGQNLDDVPTFAAYRRSAVSGWSIVIGVPQDVLYKTVDGRLLSAGIVTLSSIVLALYLAFGFSRRLENSLRKLAAATRSAGEGEPEVVVPIDAPREVVEVAQRFNEMQASRNNALATQRRVKRALMLLNESNTALLLADHEEELLEELCRLIVQEGDYRMAWVGFAQEDEDRSVRPLACFGEELGYLRTIKVSWGDGEFGRGPAGTAIRTHSTQVCHDIAASSLMTPWAEPASRRGYRSCVAIPLMIGDNTAGVLTIYAGEPNAMGQEEVGLLEKLAANLSFGIEQLRTREKLAIANKELEGFTYAASHDIKGPLQRIVAFSGILERNHREELSEDAQTLLDFVRGNAIRIMALVEDLLSHAQIEQVSLALMPVRINDAVQAVVAEKTDELKDAGVEVRVDLPDVAVRANPFGLAQVLRNLLDNGLKYSAGAKPPRIEIGGRSDGQVCRLWVRDNGVGFDMAYHDRIFEIFRRLHTYAEIPGSGVGLALVRKAMDRMGGRVWAESSPGEGATFHIELPLDDSAREISPSVIEKPLPKPASSPILPPSPAGWPG